MEGTQGNWIVSEVRKVRWFHCDSILRFNVNDEYSLDYSSKTVNLDILSHKVALFVPSENGYIYESNLGRRE